MIDPRHDNLAKLLVEYSLDVQPGQKISIRGAASTVDMMRACYRAVLRVGALPMLLLDDNTFHNVIVREGNNDQINWFPPHVLTALTESDGVITLYTSENTRLMTNAPLDKQTLYNKAYHGKMIQIIGERAREKKMRWVLIHVPTNAYAQDADMSLEEYETFVYNACQLNEPDPAQAWREFSAWQQQLVNWMVGKKEVIVKGSNIDMIFSIDGRTFINSDAQGYSNMPDGEIFTGPVESSVNGWVQFTYPINYRGNEVRGARLVFKDGKVVEASADKNEAFLIASLDTDEGARFLGEFAIGTNRNIQQFTGNTLYDKKMNGTIHMALGRSIKETGGVNESAIHWDMVCDMKEDGQIWVDGELFYDSGRFVVLGE